MPALTFAATYEAVSQAGGRPVPADVRESDYNLDPAGVDAAVGQRTRSVLPVHLYGQLADMRAFQAIVSGRGLTIVEDACQAHGAERDGIRAGIAGTAAAFSFYPAKNLGGFGDAGALVTDDAELAERVRVLREHGQSSKYMHVAEGYTARLDTIQAIVLLEKLPRLNRWNDDRRRAAAFYSEALEGVGDLRLPREAAGSKSAWHLYVVRTADPDRLGSFLGERGIMTGRHYPQPPHLSPAYEWLGYRRGAFPVAERLADEVISLPLFPGITDTQLSVVVEAISDYFNRG